MRPVRPALFLSAVISVRRQLFSGMESKAAGNSGLRNSDLFVDES
jgi:hypothetical protein